MNYLENRVPPPVVLLISLVIMRFIAMFDKNTWLMLEYHTWVAVGICVVGVAIAIVAVAGFKKAQTTVNPLAPERASRLVVHGIFKVSRNPMYLGMTLVAIAWAVYLGSLYSLSGVIIFMLFITRFQIKPEERAMATLFGDEFERYARSTRRWV